MKSNASAPTPYFLVNSEGLEEVRSLKKDIQSAVETLQKKMAEIREAIPLEKRLFTLAEAAVYLAVSESYLRKDCSEGPRANRTPGPKFTKIGDMIRYTREDLDAWIDQHRNTKDVPDAIAS